MLAGGCQLVQLRCKGWADDEWVRVGRIVLERCLQHDAILLINDRVDLVHAIGAHGAHVGQLDLPVDRARALLGDDLLLGVSHNTLEGLETTLAHADYLAVGPAWPTPRLSYDKPVRGLELIREARRRTTLPLVAIGGIDLSRVPAVREAGADAWAVIGAIQDAPDPVQATRALVQA